MLFEYKVKPIYEGLILFIQVLSNFINKILQFVSFNNSKSHFWENVMHVCSKATGILYVRI